MPTVRQLLNSLDYWAWLVLEPDEGYEGIGTVVRGRDWFLGMCVPDSLFGLLDRTAYGLRTEMHMTPAGDVVPMLALKVKKPKENNT